MNPADDEMFDDLHQGVEALRTVVETQSMPLSKRAVATLQRLENTMPAARIELRLWKQKLTRGAVKVAQKTDIVIHEYPWFFMFSALGLGLLAGLVLVGLNGEEDGPSSTT